MLEEQFPEVLRLLEGTHVGDTSLRRVTGAAADSLTI